MAIDRIYERDVDVVLIEEFAVSSGFAAWVLSKSPHFGVLEAEVVETHLSLFNKDGESDLVIIYHVKESGERIAFLVEDKIDATFQPEQAQRYRVRGDDGISAGTWARYETVLCAPKSRLGRCDKADFDFVLAYEDIAAYFRSCGGNKREEYRAEFFESAAPRGVSAYVKIKDRETDDFWNAAYALARRDFPDLEMKAPDYASQTWWVVFRPSDFPKRVHVDLKAKNGFADLTFSGLPFIALETTAKSILTSKLMIRRTGKSTVIRATFPSFTVAEGNEIISTKVRVSLECCQSLIHFYREHRSELEPLVAAP